MIRRPPGATRTYTLFPYTMLFRLLRAAADGGVDGDDRVAHLDAPRTRAYARSCSHACNRLAAQVKAAFIRTDAPFSFRLSPRFSGRVGGLLPKACLTRGRRQPIWPGSLTLQGQDDRHGQDQPG